MKELPPTHKKKETVHEHHLNGSFHTNKTHLIQNLDEAIAHCVSTDLSYMYSKAHS